MIPEYNKKLLEVLISVAIANSYFKKKEEHLVTFKSENIRTQINYFLMRDSRRLCRDYKVIPSECLMTQHMLLVMDVEKEEENCWGL